MLIAVQQTAPVRVTGVRTAFKGRRVLEVVEGIQQVAPGIFERVEIVINDRPAPGRKLWN